MKTTHPKSFLAKAAQGGRFLFGAVNHLMWPAVCLRCREGISEEESGLCRQCWGQLMACIGGDYCPRCGVNVGRYAIVAGSCPSCKNQAFDLDGIARAGVYENALRDMVLGFKKGKTELDYVLGSMARSAFEGSCFREKIEYFVPVPLHWFRHFVRGYNQSFVLAKKVKSPAIKISTDFVRMRYTRQQPTMPTAARRKANVSGAFAVRRGHPFKNRNICLVDDVKTSGATLNECAKTLKEAGASSVFAVVLAVAGQNLFK